MASDKLEVERLIDRMKRVEGQARGVQRMLQEGRPCEEVVTQLVAMREAISRVAMQLIGGHLEQCLAENMDMDEALKKATDLMIRLS
ncbi:MAG: metal-sensitive transcriptional regulator [Bacteroidota bacterium]|jgi:DNA-binding FrmR family transcriptional regulator